MRQRLKLICTRTSPSGDGAPYAVLFHPLESAPENEGFFHEGEGCVRITGIGGDGLPFKREDVIDLDIASADSLEVVMAQSVVFDCTEVGEDQKRYGAATGTLRRPGDYQGYIEVVGTDQLLMMLKTGKRYRITVEEVTVIEGG